MVPSQPEPSDGPTAAAPRPTHGTPHNVPTTAQDQSSRLPVQRSPGSVGNDQPLSLASEAASPDDALETASQSSEDTSHAKLTGEGQSTQQPSPISSPKSSLASAGTETLGHGCGEIKTTSRPPISESLGLWTCVILAGGTALIFAALGFLVFLWLGEGPAGGESATYLWRKIMLDESWSAQTVTICTLVVRTVATAQAAVCTSLVAALLLERRRLPLSKVVPISLKRGINDGPFSLIREVHSWKCLQTLGCVETGLLVLVTLMTSGTQFVSTILLSGFNTTTLVQFPQQLHHKVILSSEAALNASRINSFSHFPSSYASFGELETSETPDPGPDGVSDTGVQLRSFVPFREQQRLSLRAYRGPALSQKTQVMCMRPNMDARVSWDKIITERGSIPMSSVTGTISYEKTFEEAALNNWTLCSSFQRLDKRSQTACLPRNFTCTLPLRDVLIEDALPVLALCHMPPEILWNKSQSSPAEYLPMWNASNSLWSADANSWIYLTLATNLTTAAVDEEFMNNRNSTIPMVIPKAEAGEWQTYQVLPAMALNVSLCFAGLQTDLYNVSMSTTNDPKEPEVRWDSEDGAESGQVFMGTTGSNLSAAERRILSISDFRHTDGLKAEDINGSLSTLWKGPYAFTGSHTAGGSYMACNFCDFAGWAIPPDIGALFTRTIHTTGRAAWAIESFLTTYTQSWYAQILPQFDVAAGIDVTFSTQVRIPRHWGGLIAALAMVLVNLVCVWAITVLYVVHTRYSRQGNVWHTVSQIMSEDTRLVLEQSNQVTDEDVEKRLKGNDYLVFIGRSKNSGKVNVLKC